MKMRWGMAGVLAVMLMGQAVPGWAALRVGDTAPVWTLTSLEGKDVMLARLLKEKKVVLVNIFNSWCPPCKAEMPDMVKVYEDYKHQGVEFFSVCTPWREDTADKAAQFTKKYGVTWPVAFDVDGAVTKDYEVAGVPTTCVITADGKVSFYKAGGLSAKQFRAVLNAALGVEMKAEDQAEKAAVEAVAADAALLRAPMKAGMPVIGVKLDMAEGGEGVEVKSVNADGPAATAGLQDGDIIQKMDGKVLGAVQEAILVVRKHKAGDELKLSILRDGKAMEMIVKIGAFTPPPVEPKD